MSPLISLIMNVIIAGLLVATIVYAIRLNRQIERLRDSRSELAELIVGLNEATANADTAVRGLRKAAGDTGEQLQRAIDKATALRDELAFMVETGDALANRLGDAPKGLGAAVAGRARENPPRDLGGREMANREMGGREMGGREMGPREMGPREMGGREMTAKSGASARPAAAPRSLIDEGLMAAARAEAQRQPNSGMPAASAGAAGKAMTAKGDGAGGGDGGDGLSRAERELLQALESRR